MQIHSFIDPYALRHDGGNSPTADIDWGGFDITNAGSVTATTFTDGTLSISSGSIASAVNGTFSGTVQAEQLTSTDDINLSGDLIFANGNFLDDTAVAIKANARQLTLTGDTTHAQFVLGGGGIGGATAIFRLTDNVTHAEFMPGAGLTDGMWFYEDSTSGENRPVRIYGYPSGDSLDYMEFKIAGGDGTNTKSQFNTISEDGFEFTGELTAGSATPKVKLTAIGGFAIKLTNKTGGTAFQGELVDVYSDTAVDDAFEVAGVSSTNVIGIALDDITDDSEGWIVVGGIADVRMDAGGSARGDRIISSGNTAGSGDVWNVGGAVSTHFQEIGHCIESRANAGLARCVLHFL